MSDEMALPAVKKTPRPAAPHQKDFVLNKANRKRALLFAQGNADVHPKGYTPTFVCRMDNSWLETKHDWIQWAFPTTTGSKYNGTAPVVAADEIAIMRTSGYQLTMKRLIARMKVFYHQTDAWKSVHDHNHLRITRILESTKLLCSPEVAWSFYWFILSRVAEDPRPFIVNPETRAIWAKVMDGHPER